MWPADRSHSRGNISSYSSGAGGRRGKFSGRSTADGRKLFTKLVRDESATVTQKWQAEKFVSGMATFENKAELLAQLTDKRNHGLERIPEVLRFIETMEDTDMLLIRILENVMTQETSRPIYQTLKKKVLWSIYLVPGLLETLVEENAAQKLSKPSASKLCSFLLNVAKAFVEARQSEAVLLLAKALRDRGDIDEARALCAVILADEDEQIRENYSTGGAPAAAATATAAAACWVTDEVPPGGRHDNDEVNYRNVKLVPTVQELECQTRPYLPLASGENAFLRDAESRLLDRNFRLLRHDAISAMRETINGQNRPWYNARIVGLDLDLMKFTGTVSFVIQCDNRYKTEAKRDWTRFRSLLKGSLVALCKDGDPVRMGTISIRDDDWLRAPGGPRIGVVFQSERDFEESIFEFIHNCGINVELCQLYNTMVDPWVDPQHEDKVRRLMGKMSTYTLIEASKSFFAYEPILRTLQGMQTVPLAEELVFLRKTGPPEYLPTELLLPTDDNFNGYRCIFDDSWNSKHLAEKTSLDMSQADALYHAFTSRVALIQGPPGTGKTFIGALIARMILQNTNETILCVCYTNHALDQFLEHMLEAGEKKIVRIGGRSKASVLEGYHLSKLSRLKTDQSDDGSRRIRQIDATIHRAREELVELLKECQSPVDWKSPWGGIQSLLRGEYPDIYSYLRAPSAVDGFNVVGPKGKSVGSDYLFQCWRRGEPFPVWLMPHMEEDRYRQYEDFVHFWAKPREERRADIEAWRREILSTSVTEVRSVVERIAEALQEKKELKQESDLQVLRDARIIGATTAGAANYKNILSEVSAGVIIVEEAGEVLESHVLTSLSEGTANSAETKHVILIGDHKQLRPKVETYQLTAVSGYGYNLDCSLFERLVTNNLPSVALGVQHRMRPSISRLIRAQTYPSLRDHESVHQYPDVKGVCENVVFIDHQHPEDGDDDGTTKRNFYEAEVCMELVRFFLLQGYRPDQVVVLTPYLGQLMLLIQSMKSKLHEVTAVISENDQKALEDQDLDHGETMSSTQERHKSVRCSSVDNFQGEEADIIIASLVRSNDSGTIGFLKEEQRVNVLLSRARLGMFIVGNASCLRRSKASKAVWDPILVMLSESGQLKKGLPTKCQLHPNDEPVLLQTPHDFRLHRPNGGCSRNCEFRMPCGHACPQTCHPIDRDHVAAQRQCCEPCRRFPSECRHGHPCPKLCKEECGPCLFDMGPLNLMCGHTSTSVRCYDVRSDEALKLLSSQCKETVEHTFAGCNHKVQTTCSNARSSTPLCPAPCGKLLACGHICKNKCSSCVSDNHDCHQKCERVLFCGHLCGRSCHLPRPCEPCKKMCRVKCSHSCCPENCSLPCAPCVEACDWFCEHQGKCPLVCGAPCARLPCNKRCEATLECGHRCPGLCGEKCPSRKYCQQCAPENLKDRVVDLFLLSTYREHDVDGEPIVFLSCGHFYSVGTLDSHLNLKEVYQFDTASNEFVDLRSLRLASTSDKPMVCPDCRLPIDGVHRYGRMLNFSMIRGLERKHMMNVDGKLDSVSKRPPSTVPVSQIDGILDEISRSPMQIIFEACRGSLDIEVPPPPTRPLIRALELKAVVFATKASREGDAYYKVAEESFLRAIEVAMERSSFRSAALLKISLVKFWLKFVNSINSMKPSMIHHMDWVIAQSQFADLVQEAQSLKERLSHDDELKEVFQAMSRVTGFDYGGSASSHWFQCPNGHPYFIGECGGAMQESVCPECGSRIGGSAHQLLPTNQRASEFLSRVGQVPPS